METTTCDICIESFNRSTRKCIECFNCQKKACSTCVRRFILESATDAKCLHCNIQWDRRFMIHNLTQKFCNNDYRQHRADLLYEQKKCFLPRVSNIMSYEQELEVLKKEEKEILTLYRQKIKEIRKVENHVHQLKDAFYSNRDENIVEEQFSNRTVQNRPCITESCLGFLDSKGYCPVCKKMTCLSCNIDKTDIENHECKEEDKAQWVELRNSTKPCPSCRVRIFKISGCDQMWCVHCNTAFSWSRGTIERGAIHNPHYFDWLFEGGDQPRQVGNNIDYCNDTELPPEVNLSSRMFEEYKKLYKTDSYDDFRKYRKRKFIFEIYRILRHLQFVEIPQLQHNEYNYRRGIYDYLVGILKKKDCKKQIEQYDYKSICNQEMAEILNGFVRENIYVFNAYMRNNDMTMRQLAWDLKQYTSIYRNGIERFEKEYKRSYKKYSRYLEDIYKKIYFALNHS